MTNTSVQKIFNSITEGSEEHFILCTEFLHYRIRILILRNNNYPLVGEVATSELWSIAKDAFPGSEEDFYLETQNVLSGQENDYKFYLESNVLKWEKNLWTRGCIQVFEETDNSNLSDFMINVFTSIIQEKKTVDSIEQENKSLQRNLKHLTSQLDNMIVMKKEMEETFLKKFILILNEKKKRIRKLENELKDFKKMYEPSAYDLLTDEEMSNENDTSRNTVDVVCDGSTLLGNENPSTSKCDNFDRAPICRKPSILDDEIADIINNVVNLVPATTKSSAEIQSENIIVSVSGKISHKSLSLEDTDEDIELRLDSLVNESQISQAHVIDDALEPDMFS